MPETTTTADGGEEAPERFADHHLVKATAGYRPLAVRAIRRAFEGRV
jgi:hypothetical protein